MSTSLVPAELLKKADKILFVAHLALGDFTYMQNCFRAFKAEFPHIKLHCWVDELRRTSNAKHWEHLKKYSLYDWLKECALFDKIYCQTYSPQLFKESIKKAQSENYPIVISFAVLARHTYARLARRLSPYGFVVAQKKYVRFYDLYKHYCYRKLDAFIPAYRITHQHRSGDMPTPHISEIYADWFRQLFDIRLSEEARQPFVDIPEKWLRYAKQQFVDWGFAPGEKVVFLNGFSKSIERSWSLERIFELAEHIKNHPAWHNVSCIINVVPEAMTEAQAFFDKVQPNRVRLFSAQENFFQLPAVLSLCQLVISVETAVMHLANAVQVRVIALMRQVNPEWVPINASMSHVIAAPNRKSWVNEIPISAVLEALPRETSGFFQEEPCELKL